MIHLQKNEEYIKLIKPGYFMIISSFLMPLVYGLAVILLLAGMYLGLLYAETDTQQGENYRIVYIHVPSAWMCMLLYVMLAISSAIYLINKHPLMAFISKSISQIGTLFTFITLVTGSLWGYPTWGTFWVWDARLTSVLILFFIYLAHLMVLAAKDNIEKVNKIASILAVVGFINIPIIKYSVDWWTTLHQGSSITQFKTSIHMSMLYPMLIIFISFLMFTIYITICNTRRDILVKKTILLKIKNK